MIDANAIRRAIHLGWEPTSPYALSEYHRCFDYEKPGDAAFLGSLAREAAQWMADNVAPCPDAHWAENPFGNETRIDCGNGCAY